MPPTAPLPHKRGGQGGDKMLTGFQATGQATADRMEAQSTVASDPAGVGDSIVPMSRKVAYLVNVYPKVSHGFIRTEIAALERLGFDVSRFTIRRTPEDFSDAEDRAEAARTITLLDGSWRLLAGAVLRSFLKRPGKACSALVRSLQQTASRVRAIAYFAEAAALAEQMERRNIRHVHVHFGTNPVTVARLAARLSAITYSFTVHGPDEFDAPLVLDLPGKIADAAFVAGVSSFGRSQLMRWSEPVHWERIQVVRCAVAPHFLQDDVTSLAGLESRTLTCVARLSAQKGLPLMVAAAARIAGSHDFTIDIIGDGEGRAALEEQIDRLNLKGRIRLLGWRSSEDVRKLLAASRALVLPSFAEGLPVVLMEALALGRPVVSTAVAGIPELLDAENGWLVPSGSVDALAEAMKAVLDTPRDRLQAMGQTGRKRVLAAHHPDINARELAALLGPCL